MNAYYFAGSTIQSQLRKVSPELPRSSGRIETWESCGSLIVCSEDLDDASELFNDWLCPQPEDENPIQARVSKIVKAQFLEQLLAEEGCVAIEWSLVADQAEEAVASASEDVSEQDHWVDVNEVVAPQTLTLSVETLRQIMPEDLQTDLNWFGGREFFFILSVLSPPSPVIEPNCNEDSDVVSMAEEPGNDFEGVGMTGLRPQRMVFPELVEKDAAVLIKARNSAVAAWLWRRYANKTPWARNAIRIDPWCGAIFSEGSDLG